MCENDCIDREPLGYISDDCAALLCERHTGRGYIYPYASPEHNTPLCLDSDRAWLQGQLLDMRAECQRLAAELQTWRDGSEAFARAAEVERMRAENESLRDALNRDRTGLAAALVEVRKVAAGYRWIGEGEWGSYEWQDRTVGTLQKETGNALDKIESIAERALSTSGVLATNAIRGLATKGDGR